ncbi:MFS transporter [Rubrobacter xylanophilus]|uniref:MFS transporter n=1 Tax=Rubrobacter xylanophilus TaxID=49319 RepID=UPI00117B54FE|nr:MFS transporter [Rubrobacter xylanophilus]
MRGTPGRESSRNRAALRFVVLLGVVDLLADATYEGARSITGPFLASLGAGAAATGFVAGLGEFAGYALRAVSGYLGDRTGRFWAITIFGYVLNLAAVPLLALVGSWQLASALMVAERSGRAIRGPARDAMLSHAGSRMGRGWAFGLHEALDQLGAVAGPLAVAAVLYLAGGYRTGFAILAVPAALSLATLALSRRLYPDPGRLEAGREGREQEGGLPRAFWLYMAFVVFGVGGFASFQLVSYHLETTGLLPGAGIPLAFAAAMGVDALVALLSGRLFDRLGLTVLASVPLLTLPVAPLAFSGSAAAALGGVLLWGAVMGVQETIMRAAVGGMVPAAVRGTAYGLFNAVYGLCWFAGSSAMGALYEAEPGYAAAFSVALELASVGPLALLLRETRR